MSGAQSLCRHGRLAGPAQRQRWTPYSGAAGDARSASAKRATHDAEFVLLEMADALSGPSLRGHTVTFINGLRRLAVLHIFPATSGLLADGWTLYSQRPDKEWGLTDCTRFVVMTQEHVTQAFTSDHHFEQAGFVKLL